MANSKATKGMPLSTMERSVLELMAQGVRTGPIGTKLYLSEHTIKNHIASIYKKLGASNSNHAIFLAVQHGWLDPLTGNARPTPLLPVSPELVRDCVAAAISSSLHQLSALIGRDVSNRLCRHGLGETVAQSIIQGRSTA